MTKKMDNGRDAIAWIRMAQRNINNASKGITPRVSLEAAMREVRAAQKRLFWLVEDLTFEINKLEDSANPPSSPTVNGHVLQNGVCIHCDAGDPTSTIRPQDERCPCATS